MEKPFIEGKTFYLRALEESDLDGPYLKWLNDPEVTRYMTAGLFPQTKKDLRSFYEKEVLARNAVYFAIVDKKTNKHIGNVKLDKIDSINRRCEFGILIGNKKYWGKGLCREVTKLVVEYAFTKLNLRKVCTGTVEENKAAIKCYKSVGFKVEGVLREMHHDHTTNKYVNHVVFGLLKREFVE